MTPKLLGLESYLKERLIGQDEPIRQACALLKRSLLGFRFPGEPLCSMLLAGGTGVGKTELALLFTDYLFGGLPVRIDMGEYKTAESLERLIGRGVASGRGTLGDGVEHTGGAGTLLFDEMEKAHPDVIDVFLQILSAARVTLATGETLNLSGYVIAATTNLGAEVLIESETTDPETIRARVLSAVQLALRPELVARFQSKIVFNALTYESSYRIAELHAREVVRISAQLGHRIELTPGVIEHIRRQGYDRAYGVRPLRFRALEELGDAVTERALASDGPVEGTLVYDPETDQCAFADALYETQQT